MPMQVQPADKRNHTLDHDAGMASHSPRARRWCVYLRRSEPSDADALCAADAQYKLIATKGDNDGERALLAYLEFETCLSFESAQSILPHARWETVLEPGTLVAICKHETAVVLEAGTQTPQRPCGANASQLSDSARAFEDVGVRAARHDKDLREASAIACQDGERAVACHLCSSETALIRFCLGYNEKPRRSKPHVQWIWGGTPSGRLRAARTMVRGRDVYVKRTSHEVWKGYDRHESVIIHGFSPARWKYPDRIFSLLDRYGARVDVSSRHCRQFVTLDIVVTSDQNPADMYEVPNDRNRLLRRIDVITALG